MPSTSNLRALSYVSSASRPLDGSDLDALFLDAMAFNGNRGIGGVLIFDGGSFTGYLEGSATAVKAAFRRIAASHQHRQIHELTNCSIPARTFDDWVMAVPGSPRTLLLQQSTERWARLASRMMSAANQQQIDANGIEAVTRRWIASNGPQSSQAPEVTEFIRNYGGDDSDDARLRKIDLNIARAEVLCADQLARIEAYRAFGEVPQTAVDLLTNLQHSLELLRKTQSLLAGDV